MQLRQQLPAFTGVAITHPLLFTEAAKLNLLADQGCHTVCLVLCSLCLCTFHSVLQGFLKAPSRLPQVSQECASDNNDLRLTAALAIRSIAESLQKSCSAVDEAVPIISQKQVAPSHTKTKKVDTALSALKESISSSCNCRSTQCWIHFLVYNVFTLARRHCGSAPPLVTSQTSKQMMLRRPKRQLLQFHSSLQFMCSFHPGMGHSILELS